MTSVGHETCEASIPNVIRVDESQVRSHLEQVVRSTVEETLNGLLDAEADELCGASRYERTPERLDTRAGHYRRRLLTKAGDVELRVPRLRSLPFETQIIERYRRRESSVEESLVEMYLAGVSVRRVEDITEALWGRPGRGPAVHERQVPGPGRGLGRVLSRGGLAAVRGALLSQRVHDGVQGEGQGSGGDAQGDSRPVPPGSDI